MSIFIVGHDIRIVSLREWLGWASGRTNEVFLALPMIQRGSTWQPHQIIDLWDSLLRGMPIASMLVSDLPAGTHVRRFGKHVSEKMRAGGGLGLIDGQQRTLAMLVAWPHVEGMDRRIWVDFSDETAPGQLPRLRVTTKNQVFGFRHNEPSRKLSLDDRRKAYEAFGALTKEEQIEPKLENARPFSHKPGLFVDLRDLIELWHTKKRDPKSWLSAVSERLRGLIGAKFSGNRDAGKWRPVTVWETLDEAVKSNVCERTGELASAFERFDRLEMPLIRVGDRFFKTESTDGSDPPLAV